MVVFGEFSGDVSDDNHFCYNNTIFCYENSGESLVVCPVRSTFFFYFMGELFFTKLKQE
jgi:hypothetical protein